MDFGLDALKSALGGLKAWDLASEPVEVGDKHSQAPLLVSFASPSSNRWPVTRRGTPGDLCGVWGFGGLGNVSFCIIIAVDDMAEMKSLSEA